MARLSLGPSLASILVCLVFALVIFGLIMVGNASVVDAARDFSDKWYYLKLQSVWAVLGLIGFGLASLWPYERWQKIARPLFLTTIVCLVLVLIPGIGSKLLGARRWISLGPFGFQPAELAKLSLVIYLATFIKKDLPMWSFLGVVGLTTGLVMLEPDLGTTIVLGGISLMMYFGGGGKLRYLFSLVPVVGILVLVMVLISPYRLARLKTFLDHRDDPLGSSYHIRQVLISLGSGGITGVGFGQSRQKYEFLPEVTTDSIFAVVAEETGLIGSTILISMFGLFVIVGLKVAQKAPDLFAANLAIGITAWIGWQAFVNLAAMVALVPLTGIPLPFISYGGSAVVVNLLACGILVNIARQK